ncbi:AAA family ATPase [Candidatus Bathyarchaeota archaeon]|nr:AAA family ATPase [Candidatus Bathyarchaeota archaeon]MBS7617359.1 AAA family ATPase [Candidatus Bathyarchaeota archaeon]
MGVFRNRDVLFHDYVPLRLPHREKEFKELLGYFKPIVRESLSIKVHVNGEIGTGKTVLCKRLLRTLEGEASAAGARLRCAYVNLAYAPKPYYAMAELHKQVAGSPAAGLSPEQMLSNVVETIVNEDSKLLVVLDEVDTYLDEGGDAKIFYLLPRAHELNEAARGRISLIYASRSFDWLKRLDAATLDTLGRTLAVKLEQYGYQQVRDITEFRADEAFKPGAIDEDVIDFIAHISMEYGGVRYALELLLGAGIIADRQGRDHVRAEDVRMANAAIPKGLNGAIYPQELSIHKQLLLKAIMETLEATGRPYVTFQDAYTKYIETCQSYNVEPECESTITDYIEDLKIEGYIIKMGKGEDKRLGMEYPFHSLSEVVEKSLKHTPSGF